MGGGVGAQGAMGIVTNDCLKKNQGLQLCWRKYSAVQQHTGSRMGMRGAKIQKEEKLTVL